MIDTQIDLPVRVVELLCSRICHDVISPVAAISNGIELLNEMGADGMDDAVGLLGHSSRQASVRLQLFRLAYGAGGSEALVTGKNVYEAFRNFIESDRVNFEWDLMNDTPDEDLNPGFFKVLTNVLILAREALIRGGDITVKKDGHTLIVTALHEKATLREGMADALRHTLPVSELSPKTVHPYITGAFGKHFGFPVTLDEAEGKITFTIAYTPIEKIDEDLETELEFAAQND